MDNTFESVISRSLNSLCFPYFFFRSFLYSSFSLSFLLPLPSFLPLSFTLFSPLYIFSSFHSSFTLHSSSTLLHDTPPYHLLISYPSLHTPQSISPFSNTSHIHPLAFTLFLNITPVLTLNVTPLLHFLSLTPPLPLLLLSASATSASIHHSHFLLQLDFPLLSLHTSNYTHTLTPSTPTSFILGKCAQHTAASPTQPSILSSSSSRSFSSSQP